jgi:hypothetical protein
MVMVFFTPKTFGAVDFLSMATPFNAAYFVTQVIIPLRQLHCTATGNDPHENLRVHFDNSPYHPEAEVPDEMARLRCNTRPHSPYSQDLAMWDFYLFARMKERLAEVMAIAGDHLRNKVISLWQKFLGKRKVAHLTTGDHWIERHEWVVEHDRACFHV